MTTRAGKIKSSLVISVYTDDVALKVILNSLLKQTGNDFEVIISEDGESENIRNTVNAFRQSSLQIQHLTQEDTGFRKNIALNRAIKVARADHLIFIDGDCVVHPAFVEAHQACARPGTACTGRRVELGKKFSTGLRNGDIQITQLTSRFFYYLNILPLLLDRVKNFESGLYCGLLHRLTRDREIRVLGCNFSCYKQDLYKINGFNEEYLAAGIGEDSDIDWRLTHSGVTIKNVKFSAIQYHLYHPRMYSPSKANEVIFNRTKKLNIIVCEKGLNE